ncbi:MAG: T9SS type A sorting domain-containing protein [Chitinophagales bacterium]|nr:T9SS type A sorting domain-containing protein [Chitinophagales bacterium]
MKKTYAKLHGLKAHKLASYSAMGAALLFTTEKTNAQAGDIIYTDIHPDAAFLMMGEWFQEEFDMNDDGVTDFSFYLRADTNPSGLSHSQYIDLEFVPENGLQFRTENDGGAGIGDNNIVKLNIDDMIAPGMQMNTGRDFQTIEWSELGYETYSLGLENTDGNFKSANNNYVGFRIPVESGSLSYYYGWLRLNADLQWGPFDDFGGGFKYSVKLKDYAIKTTADEAIAAGEGMPCIAPEPEGASAITPTSAKLKWNPVVNADEYQIFYRQVGTTDWNKKKIMSTQKTVNGLVCDTEYEWKIRSICGDEISGFSALQTFMTASCRLADPNEITELEIVNVYPNPASDILFVELENFDEDISMEIFDIVGNKIENFNSGIEDEMISIDISQLPAGVYVLNISATQSNTSIQFIRQ